MARSAKELEPYEFRDPGAVVRDAMERRRIRDGDVVISLVRNPATEQRLIDVRKLPSARWRDLDQHDLSQLIAATACRMRVPPWRPGRPPWHSFLTIVARRGPAIIGRVEARWLNAWHFSNHGTGAFDGGLVVVTPHGWTDFMTDLGGYEPRLAVEAA